MASFASCLLTLLLDIRYLGQTPNAHVTGGSRGSEALGPGETAWPELVLRSLSEHEAWGPGFLVLLLT